MSINTILLDSSGTSPLQHCLIEPDIDSKKLLLNSKVFKWPLKFNKPEYIGNTKIIVHESQFSSENYITSGKISDLIGISICHLSNYYEVFEQNKLQTENILKLLKKSKKKECVKNLNKLLINIEKELKENYWIFNYISNQGYLDYSEDEESLDIEWIFPEFRIGFYFVENYEKSGWFLVTDSSLGYMQARGLFINVDLELIIKFFIYFIYLYESNKT